MASSEDTYDELISYTDLKMQQYRNIKAEIEDLEKEEEDILAAAYGEPGGDIGAVMDQVNELRDQVLCLTIEIEYIWSDMHAHRANLLTHYRDQIIAEM